MLQHALPGQAGTQRFFTEGERAFCLYVVIGSYNRRHAVIPLVNDVLATITIEPRAGAATAVGPTILDVVGDDPDLATLAELLPGTGVDELLASPGPLTLFAPSEAASAASGELDSLRADPGRRAKVLMHHVVRDELPTVSLDDGQALPTVEGQDVVVAMVDGRLTVGGAAIARPDLDASNGVVHVIDAVIVPPDSPPPPPTTLPPPSTPEPSSSTTPTQPPPSAGTTPSPSSASSP